MWLLSHVVHLRETTLTWRPNKFYVTLNLWQIQIFLITFRTLRKHFRTTPRNKKTRTASTTSVSKGSQGKRRPTKIMITPFHLSLQNLHSRCGTGFVVGLADADLVSGDVCLPHALQHLHHVVVCVASWRNCQNHYVDIFFFYVLGLLHSRFQWVDELIISRLWMVTG